MEQPQILPLGPNGVLVRFSDALSEPANRAALAFRADLAQAGVPGVVETASALTSVYLRFRPDQVARAALEDLLTDRLLGRNWAEAPLPEGRTLWHMPACFEGGDAPDLEDIATLAGLSGAAAVQEICATRLRVLALGFAPGQPYLGFLPEHWNIPRQTDVTAEVPQGAVVVAVRQVIPFANAAPTGWRQIGRTAFRCFDGKSDLPLNPGDEVQFHPVPSLAPFAGDLRGGAEAEALT